LKIALSSYLSRELSSFNQIWYVDVNFHHEGWFFDKESKFCKFKMADGCHIENRFWLYLGTVLADVCESWTTDVESWTTHAIRGHVTKTAIFANST